MQSKDIKVTCLSCQGFSRIKIINDRDVMYIDHTPIIACRLRPDLKWGFECICGNDSRLAPEEKNSINVLVQGAQHVIDRILQTIDIKAEKKFSMEIA